MPSPPAIQIASLSKRFGRRQAVADLCLTVETGRIYGFLGPNGAGKTTTIRVLMGLLRPTTGEARLFGRPCGSPAARADGRVGALVEAPAFYDYLSGRENLAIYARLSGGASRAEIDWALDRVGLKGREQDRVRTYSHGMRQRLGLAQAMLPMPRLMIVDEPAIGLDPQGLADIRELLIGLNRDHDVTIFLSSHLLHEVEQICTHVGVIVSGRMVAEGEVSVLLSQPDAPVTIRVSDSARAAALLRRVPGVTEVSEHGGAVSVVSPRELVADINEVLVREGIRVYAIEPLVPTLEQVYMRLTGERADAPAPVAAAGGVASGGPEAGAT
jgi:ABC-type multidrug transport system ATPase subunit